MYLNEGGGEFRFSEEVFQGEVPTAISGAASRSPAISTVTAGWTSSWPATGMTNRPSRGNVPC